MAESIGDGSKGDKMRLPSTSSLGPQEIPKADLVALSNETFGKTAAYLSGELEGTAEEYSLLERMNNTTAQRYIDMKQISQNIKKSMGDLNDKYLHLQPYLDQIDEIDHSSRRLEEAAYALDAYVKSLENKFKQLDKRP